MDQQFGRSVRYHSPDYVIGYWKWLVEDLGVNEVHVYDDTFTLNKKRTLEICRRLQEEGLDKASWTVRTRVDTINEGDTRRSLEFRLLQDWLWGGVG